MPDLRHRIVKNGAAALAAVLVAALLAEGLLRLSPGILPESTQLRLHWAQVTGGPVISTGDPHLGFLYPPSYRGEIDRGDTRFTYRTDEYGFRNPGPWPDTAEVVIVGDSQAFGYGVEDDEAWARGLAHLLAPSRVVNLGLIGAAPQQYTRVLERFGLPLSPKVILYCLFPGNDIEDGRLFERWESAGSPGNYDVWRFFRGRPPNDRGITRLTEQSHLIALVRTARQNLGSRFAGQTVTLEDGTRLRLAPNVYRASSERAESRHPDFQRVIEATRAASALAERDGRAFLTVLVPTKEEVYLPILGQRSPELVGPYATELERLGIEHLDLTPAFQAEARRSDVSLFFEIDGHPNAAGNWLMARAIGDHLLENADRYRLHVED